MRKQASAGGVCTQGLNFFATLLISVNEYESTVGIDLGVTYEF